MLTNSTLKHKSRKRELKTTNESQLLSKLLNPASPVSGVSAKSIKHRSRFFFTVEDSELVQRKSEVKKKEISSVYTPIDKRIDSYSKELPASLDPNIKKVREFILTTLSPLLLAAETGSRQAIEIISKSLDSPADGRALQAFDSMLVAGYNLKICRFLIKYLGLTAKDAETLMGSLIKAPTHVVFPSVDSVKSEPLVPQKQK